MEKWDELVALMLELEGKDRILEEQTTRMFNLHNIIFPHILEYNKSCPACRERVYNRLKKYWLENEKK